MTHYTYLRNAKCIDGFPRCWWKSLGRNQASQNSSAIDELGRLFTWGQNYWGQSGQGDWHDDTTKYETEFCTQIGSERNWVKAYGSESGFMALNKRGELWCAGSNFADGAQWGYAAAILPNANYHPLKCNIPFKVIDFSYGGYNTLIVDENRKLWTMGDNWDYILGQPVLDAFYHEPTRVAGITEDVLMLDTEEGTSAIVTTDNKVYLMGCDFSSQTAWDGYSTSTPWEVTGLTVPAGESIVGVSVSSSGVSILLSDGTVWIAGNDGLKMDGTDYWTSGSTTFQQLTAVSGKFIVKVQQTSLGAYAHFCLDNEGNIWGYSDSGYDWWQGNTIPVDPPFYTMILVGAENAGNRKYVDFCCNDHNGVFQAIDDRGYLWCWNTQAWGPHLGIGAKSFSASGTYDTDDLPKVYASQFPILATQGRDYAGNETTHNTVDAGISEYMQFPSQILEHRPCGHWHVRLFEGEEEYPKNCWMPSLTLRGDELMFVAAGKHWWADPVTGNEILMFTYSTGGNTWTQLMRDDLIYAANDPGGTDFRGNYYAFSNYKLDQVGAQWNEAFDNAAIGVWVVNKATGVMNYNEFTNIDGGTTQSIINKVGVYNTGLVAVAYRNNANQLEVQVSTDGGVTFNSKKTVALTAGYPFSLIVDDNGYIYIAYKSSSSSATVERSTNQGTTWSTQGTCSLLTGVEDIKLEEDASRLYLLGRSATKFACRQSINAGVTWTTVIGFTQPAYPSIVGHACYTGNQDVCVADGELHNYYYANGASSWYDRVITQLDGVGEWVNVTMTGEKAVMSGSTGRFAYAAWGFFTEAHRAVAVAVSMDGGVTWTLRETPLKYYVDYTELGDFDGNPLFYLSDSPHLNPTWEFTRDDWAETFIKQIDKY